MRLFELPFPLCPLGQISIAPLVERTRSTQTSFSVFIGQDYDAGDDIDVPTSYRLLANVTHFARRGRLIEDYPLTRLIDDYRGLTVELTGVDVTLSEQSLFNALNDEYLCFVDDEIMSVAETTLIGPNIYILKLVRERFGTYRAAHAADGEGESRVYLMPRAWLAPLQHDSFKLGNTASLKVSIRGQIDDDLGDIDPLTHAFAGTVFDVEPLNLRVNGEIKDCSWNSGEDVRVEWSVPLLRRSLSNKFDEASFRTLVQIYTPDGATLKWKKFTGTAYMQLGRTWLATHLGLTDFRIRISTHMIGTEAQFITDHVETFVKKL